MTHEELLVGLAQDYYYSDLSISELSRKYKLSRYLIDKYLDEALKVGIVSIQIHAQIDRNYQLEAQLQKTFGIAHVSVLRGDASANSNNLIKYAAEKIQLLISHSHVVGLAWGGTIHSIIDQFQTGLNEELIFTQFVGENMKYNSRTGSTRMVEHAASRFSADYAVMPAPLYVVNQTVHDALLDEPALQKTLHLAARMDLLFCGIGTLESINSIPVWRDIKHKIFPGVNTDEIVGMLFGRPYNIKGQFLLPQRDTVMGTSLENVLLTPRRFGIIKSKFKTHAALGALRGKMLTDLIIDEGIAQRILTANAEE